MKTTTLTLARARALVLPGLLALAAAPSIAAPVPGAAPSLAPAQEEAGPELWIDERDHDFGRVLQGEVLEHTWAMSNKGKEDLIITQAKPTCGCTVSNLLVKDAQGETVEYQYGDPIRPGTTFQLTASLNTKNKTSVAKSKINIFSNDARGLIQLSLSAEVTTYFRVSPSTINFGDLTMSDASEKTVEVSGQSGEPFELSVNNEHLPPGMAVELEPQDADAEGRAKRWTVTVRLGEGKTEGRLGYPLQLQSDQIVNGAPKLPDGSEPTYVTTIMVTGNVKGLISFSPSYLSFGLLRPGQVASRTVRIEVNDPKFELGAPEVVLTGYREGEEFPYAQHFTHTVRPVEGGQIVDVELTLNGFPDDVDGSFQGRMLLKTGHPDHPEFPVAFSGVVRGGVGGRATGG